MKVSDPRRRPPKDMSADVKFSQELSDWCNSIIEVYKGNKLVDVYPIPVVGKPEHHDKSRYWSEDPLGLDIGSERR